MVIMAMARLGESLILDFDRVRIMANQEKEKEEMNESMQEVPQRK